MKFILSIVNHEDVCEEQVKTCMMPSPSSIGQGWRQVMRRLDILDPANKLLKDGDLCIDATIQLKQKDKAMYLPPSSHSQKMLRLLKSEEDADVSGSRQSRLSFHHLPLQPFGIDSCFILVMVPSSNVISVTLFPLTQVNFLSSS